MQPKNSFVQLCILKTDVLSLWCTCIYDSLVIFVLCFVYVVKRLEHLIKMDMALYNSYSCIIIIIKATYVFFMCLIRSTITARLYPPKIERLLILVWILVGVALKKWCFSIPCVSWKFTISTPPPPPHTQSKRKTHTWNSDVRQGKCRTFRET